ncbi:MAG: metalloregulator ArsR/SmtB family transcription factor, partial [Pseudomonadota bacterium]
MQQQIASTRPSLDTVLSALADPTRRTVVELLGTRPHRAGELAKAIGVPPARLSRHLKVLLEAGLASDTRPTDDARARVFQLEEHAITPVQAWLDQLQT